MTVDGLTVENVQRSTLAVAVVVEAAVVGVLWLAYRAEVKGRLAAERDRRLAADDAGTEDLRRRLAEAEARATKAEERAAGFLAQLLACKDAAREEMAVMARVVAQAQDRLAAQIEGMVAVLRGRGESGDG